ncbi:hypothetical protein [Brucella pseudogrignonensis]|uniref:Uncharacterized protein n=1 Tax=Brucella pseudogrignonensis TaxID=419475 RepID=A0ABU1MBV6_9HYPH|nr:hypothetical protein [Brucella pseudogrignonensis]MDR6433537.1 hypothetical protein [Brucella pseudogrignonensis]
MKTFAFSLAFSAILFSSAFASLRYTVAGSSNQIRQLEYDLSTLSALERSAGQGGIFS